MALTDRQAADLRKEDVAGKAYQTLNRHKQSNRHQPALGFRNGLHEAVRELNNELISIYAELDGAGESPLRDDLVKVIGDRISAFIQSCVAGVRGDNAGHAAREGARLISSYGMGGGRDFDLAVHERLKRQPAAASTPAPVAPARRKQDKFEILDSPRQYDVDFNPSVGLLGVSVIYFDLDDFKQLNTRFTEPVIDKTLLPELQRVIAALVVDRGYAYAEGGDEFIIMLPNTNTALAEVFASVLLEQIRSTTFSVDSEAVKITATAGVASSMNADDAQACRDAASVAKREAKQQGKDRYVVSALRT
jgi:diguanylate cyclase (GGDEF)-like protein